MQVLCVCVCSSSYRAILMCEAGTLHAGQDCMEF